MGVRLRTSYHGTLTLICHYKGRRWWDSLRLPDSEENRQTAILVAGKVSAAMKCGDLEGQYRRLLPGGTRKEWLAMGAAYSPRKSDYAPLYHSAKKRAKKTNRGWELSRAEFDDLVRRAQGQCMVCGLPFRFEKEGTFRRPFAPSLDRIDSRGPYSAGNVRLVCVAVNYALNDWGEDVFLKIAAGAVRLKKRAK